MTKERFIEGYGVPLYTVGVGGSGGAIQQYVYAQRHPGVIIDAAIPQYSYSDMVTQTIHVGDCELLEHYMDVTDGANPKWAVWPNRTWLEGLNASATRPNPYRGGALGNSECVNGWRGLTPLALNPQLRQRGRGLRVLRPGRARRGQVDALGRPAERLRRRSQRLRAGALGQRRRPVRAPGAQRREHHAGRVPEAERDGRDLERTSDMVQEGCPFFPAPAATTRRSTSGAGATCGSAPTAASRPHRGVTGNMAAANAAYTSGIVFRGDIDIPIIDWRHYLEAELDMHHSHQSFATRKRMLNFDGDASNQVVWFTDARPARASDQTPLAFAGHRRVDGEHPREPGARRGRQQARAAVDSCFATNGSLIYAGGDAWAGILDSRPAGPCTQAFPLYATSRIVSGGPIEGSIFKCALKPVATAIADGTYAPWLPGAADVARLQQIFPTGVCDYSKPDVGRPPGF